MKLISFLYADVLRLLLSLILMTRALPSMCAGNSEQSSSFKKPLKVLVLIICSDDQPVYKELQQVWRAYMNSDPSHIEAYFIRGEATLDTPYHVAENTIWCKTEEGLRPGIINKTLLSIEAMLQKNDKFDYLLRTNLSSFYVFPRLLKYLEGCPSTHFYAAGCCFGEVAAKNGIDHDYGEGSGFLLSNDLVKLMANNKDFLMNSTDPDDVAIARFFIKYKIPLVQHERMAFTAANEFDLHKEKVKTSECFSFRVKGACLRSRVKDDMYIHKNLLRIFYQKELP